MEPKRLKPYFVFTWLLSYIISEIIFFCVLGKWHLGLNCKTLNDYCHHPLNNGFNYFYGVPLTLINECEPGGLLEIDAPFRAQLIFITQLIGFAVLTMVVVKYTNLLAISGKVVFCCALFGILFFLAWYIKYGFLQYWSCILMKNYEIIEQPMNVQRASADLIREAQQFIERYVKYIPQYIVFVGLTFGLKYFANSGM